MNTGAMKGRKPISVCLDGEEVPCATWRGIFEKSLKECNKIPEKHNELMRLRNQYYGRKRLLLADSKNELRSPLEIDKDLYVETHYDTQTLMNLLLRIFTYIGYDYKSMRVTVRA
ncbi:MAG: hypothetical protein LBB57_03555 [Clostridiales Family XIII bacterium]|jgi:hypothetical protein|nr:hypothetical protein [Clostridiales Family XIII bacterium]